MNKVCKKCKESKDIEEFPRHSGCKDGRYNVCKRCKNLQAHEYYVKHEARIKLQREEFRSDNSISLKEKSKIYYDNNKQEISIRARTRNIKHKEKVILIKAKQRAKERHMEFNLTIDDIIIPEICPVLGIPIYRDLNKLNDNSPTLDRIDNTKGYVKGNVCVISHRANQIKSNGTVEEHKKVIQYIEARVSSGS
jgi:hypothetical protein